jgi:hypothetical protein
MALDKGTFKLTKTRSFEDRIDPGVLDKVDVMGVALVDGQGEQTGTLSAPLAVSSEAMDDIRVQLRIMNLHLAHISGEKFTEEDVEL